MDDHYFFGEKIFAGPARTVIQRLTQWLSETDKHGAATGKYPQVQLVRCTHYLTPEQPVVQVIVELLLDDPICHDIFIYEAKSDAAARTILEQAVAEKFQQHPQAKFCGCQFDDEITHFAVLIVSRIIDN